MTPPFTTLAMARPAQTLRQQALEKIAVLATSPGARPGHPDLARLCSALPEKHGHSHSAAAPNGAAPGSSLGRAPMVRGESSNCQIPCRIWY